jgi:branched-chain amino acid transport system permease protein
MEARIPVSGYLLHFFIYFSIYAIAGFGLTVAVGYGGFFTLAQAAFFALGCYVYALGTAAWGVGIGISLLLAIALSAVFSLSLSLAAWRLKGDFFIMGSLAIQSLILSVLNNGYRDGYALGSLRNLTNGPSGIPGIPRPAIFGIVFDTETLMAALAGAVLLAVFCYLRLVLDSPWGRVITAMRDDELAARSLGKNVKLLKVEVFALSSVAAAVAGVIFASYVGYVDPTLASLDQSVLMLSMVIVGGLGSLRGALLGAALLILLPEILRYANFPDQVASSLRLMAYGLLLVVMMHLRPQGIWGRFEVK